MSTQQTHVPPEQVQEGQSSPMELLLADHEVILKGLTLLTKIAADLDQGQAVNRETRQWIGEFFSEFVDGYHHRKEERGLFPMLEQAGVPVERGPLGIMLREHEQGRQFLQLMTSDVVDTKQLAKLVKEYVSFLRTHIEKENRVLFPMAEHTLSDGEKRELIQFFKQIRQVHLEDGQYQHHLSSLAAMEEMVGQRKGEQP